MNMSPTKQGVLFALAAYGAWGLFPVYFKQLEHLPADEILTYRVVFSAIFMTLIVSIAHGWTRVINIARQPKKLCLLAVSSLLIGSNWLLYIWAINNGHMLESSLGYFINPLVNVFLGVILLRERLQTVQWVAVGLAIVGVLVQLWTLGSLPWIALGLAFTFGFYALIRKKLGVDSNSGLLIETLCMTPAVLVYLLFYRPDSIPALFTQESTSTLLLVIGTGVVTSVPLLFFNSAATRLRLSTLGFFQYISPSLLFFLAVFIYGEQITVSKLITFLFIWSALALLIISMSYSQRLTHTALQKQKKEKN